MPSRSSTRGGNKDDGDDDDKKKKKKSSSSPLQHHDDDEEEEEEKLDRRLLHPSRRVHVRDEELHHDETKSEWARAYWLGLGLFLVLFAFWLLDTLKDPIFGQLVSGNLDRHQPPAKLLSVCTTLFLVCCLEYLAQEEQRQKQSQQNQSERERSHEDVLDGGGRWSRMELATTAGTTDSSYRYGYGGYNDYNDDGDNSNDDQVSSRIFLYVCLPYCVFFGVMASLLQFHPLVALADPSSSLDGANVPTAAADPTTTPTTTTTTYWHVVGYCLFAAIESFGSLAVASYWSFVNTTLSLQDAERFYGVMIAIAQLGAILGASMVTTHIWSSITLIVLACLVIILHVVVMRMYSRRYPPTSDNNSSIGNGSERGGSGKRQEAPGAAAAAVASDNTDHENASLWSGVYLILRHNYVLLILGASCLYEITLTCLHYQLALLGWSRFEESDQTMSFKQFMGHYGQMVNVSSLLLSSIGFPWLIRTAGLRWTIRIFPSLLLVANGLAFVAVPGNLMVLFFSMSLLKAMTYSIHDPAKEILYLPTSNAIKFKSKFWIDVVGARIAKAVGSTINRFAGSVDRSIQVASAPSLLTAAALWWVCYTVGEQFDCLVETGSVVGVSHDEDGDAQNVRKVDSYSDLFQEVVVFDDGGNDNSDRTGTTRDKAAHHHDEHEDHGDDDPVGMVELAPLNKKK